MILPIQKWDEWNKKKNSFYLGKYIAWSFEPQSNNFIIIIDCKEAFTSNMAVDITDTD